MIWAWSELRSAEFIFSGFPSGVEVDVSDFFLGGSFRRKSIVARCGWCWVERIYRVEDPLFPSLLSFGFVLLCAAICIAFIAFIVQLRSIVFNYLDSKTI